MHSSYISTYQYTCDPYPNATTVDKSTSSELLCGYKPYQLVSCEVLAYNEAGEGKSSSTGSIRSPCAG